jgi:hypothetical protein
MTKRETRKRWVQRGRYAVEVDIEVRFPADAPEQACLEPKTAKFLNEIAQHAKAGDLAWLRGVGRVFEALPA